VDQVESTKSQLHLTFGMTCNISFVAVRETEDNIQLKKPTPKCQ
jgi:hypothetical protein